MSLIMALDTMEQASLRTGFVPRNMPGIFDPGGYDIVTVQSMAGRHIRVADRLVGTTIHAFFASLACIRMSDVRMTMPEKDYFS
jgi:hypothetical protein